MENTDIARIFNEIADMLEIKGGDRFRIRSYRNAAVAIEGLPESLAALHEKHGLEHIPGIGQSTRAKIEELLTTGRCARHRELAAEVPSGLLEVIKVAGIGPKKANALYRELGVKDLKSLEKAARKGALREITGFGELTEKKILRGLAELKSFGGRFGLHVALRRAEKLTGLIAKLPGVDKAVPAGSLRRWRETIGDIDILVTCAKPGPVMELIAGHAEVKEVAARGDTKTSVVMKDGLRVDIRVVEKKSFGAALLYFTGSKEHNVALRDRAKKMGLKISEYGVFDSKGRMVAGKTEEEVYASVGLEWMEPEMREMRGEIEAAEKGKLPRLIEQGDIKGDMHLHTTDSDGAGSLADMAAAAMERGYRYMVVTDHSRAVTIAHGLDEKRALRQIEAIDAFNASLRKKRRSFVVLKGTEVDIMADGSLDHPAHLLKKFDCVVASVHSHFGMDIDAMTKRIIKAVVSGLVHIIGHPTGRLIGQRPPYHVDMEKVMAEAKKRSVAMEVNSYPDRLDLNDLHCRLARDTGVLLAISTDSHSPGQLGNILYGVHTARRGWIEKKGVLNARPLKEVMKFLNKGR